MEIETAKWFTCEVCCCGLTDEQIAAEAAEIARICSTLEKKEIRVECAGGQGILIAEQIPEAVQGKFPSGSLKAFEGNFWTMDLTLFLEGAAFEFCHHDGVHVRTENKNLLVHFRDRWHTMGLPVNTRIGETWTWEFSLNPEAKEQR